MSSQWLVYLFLSLNLLAPAMLFPQDDSARPSRLPNWKLPTLGGKQVWTDHAWQQGWRIQQNALTGHWRLLDALGVRQAWGNRAACQQALLQQQFDSSPPTSDLGTDSQVVILLHGLLRSSSSMRGLADSLAVDPARTVICFEYASTRGNIADHAQALREVVAGLPNNTRLNFVGHSMGNIVLRHAWADWQRDDDGATLERIDRVVMLGPPNQGAAIARQLARTGVFGWVVGPGGMELGPNWPAFEANLAIPSCPFGIVAGRLPTTNWQNPLIDGDSDFVVSVDETRLPGATDFLEVPRLHSFLMDDPQVQQGVDNFLNYGKFISP